MAFAKNRRCTVSDEQSPLKPMGTQSRETLAMAEALSPAGVLARQREYEEALAPLAGVRDDAPSLTSTVAGKAGEAADRALGKAKAKIGSAARGAQAQATAAVADYTRADPLRAVFVAAGVGAALMIVLSSMARSGARAVDRTIRR
jgi:ElaB/YqjD/DUF883 family membrane-anchored ribosome-binding protein